MKRIKFACLEQTIHFELNENLEHSEAVRQSEMELERYKADLNRKGIQYTVDEETHLENGTPMLRIRRQYNSYQVGTYLD